jgi:glycosyltransferase involved in cell wall biosynthesis
MKILVIVPWYEPAWGAGGTATAVSLINRELVKLGVEVTVLTTNDAGGGEYLDVEMDKRYEFGGVGVYYYACNFFLKSKEAFYSSGLVSKMEEKILECDMVHIHGTRHAYGFFASRYALKHGKKYIITPHASLMRWWMDKIGSARIKKLYMRLVESSIIEKSESLHFLTEDELEQSANYTYGAKSFIVSNGIEVSKYKRDLDIRKQWRTKYNVEDKTVLLFLGRIHPQKNLHLMIESIRDFENMVLFIVGPVGDKEYNSKLLQNIQKNKLENRVIFIPPVDKDSVKKWYWFADFFVSPSIVEGVSMSIIEALASSLPVIVSKNVANYKEIEKDGCGIVVGTTTIEIKNILSSIESGAINIHQMTENAKLSANNRYDISLVGKRMKENYLRILSE